MMRNVLRSYRLIITAEAPVFIGGGRELSKKEYLFLRGNSEVGVVDINKLYMLIKRRGKTQSFERFMVNDPRGLYNWLRDEAIGVGDIKDCYRYVLDVGDNTMSQGRSQLRIMEFVKDPYDAPYIPGSSVKGMLRTLLLSEELAKRTASMDKGELLREIGKGGNKRSYLQQAQRKIEADIFNELGRNENKRMDAVNDRLGGLMVSDSNPLSMSDFVLCQKVELHTDGHESTLNLLRECIRPGTQVEFMLTVDTSLCDIDGDAIMRAASVFRGIYDTCFAGAYKSAPSVSGDAVYLGGGAGYPSKTVTYPLFGKQDGTKITMDIFKNTRVPYKHGHDKDKAYGVSPHILKCTRYNGGLYQMGACSLKVEEVNDNIATGDLSR